MKLIGIALRENVESELLYVKDKIMDYVNTDVILIPPYSSEDILDLCSGFIIPGGHDIEPLLYKEKNTNSKTDPLKIDLLDLKICEYAYRKNKPLLGICRGAQVINVYFGGTLYQDIKNHSNTKHMIETSFFKSENYLVTSMHHQSIKKLGTGLIEIAHAEHILEGFIHETHKIIGVQFHPELDWPSQLSEEIMDLFISWL